MIRYSLGVLLKLLVCLSLSSTLSAADQDVSLWPPLPESMLRDAQAAMFMNRPRALLDSLEKSATEAGVAIDPVHNFIARRLYRSNLIDGIDFDRPAMFLWRKGRAPLVGIIPISDREAFLKSFGRVRVGNSLMIRVGENQGTTVYKQNTDQGMVEYRLLIRDNTAFLGRSAAECNLLSEIKLSEEASSPMYRFYIDRPFDFLPRIEDFLGPSVDPLEAELKSLIISEYDILLQAIRAINISVSVDVKQNLQCRCLVVPQKESGIELWAARQQNQSSRLLPLLDFDQSSLAIYGNISWAGGIKETGTRIAKFMERYAGEDNDIVAKALSAWAALSDRQAAFADCVHVKARGVGDLDVYGLGVHEQARAVEMLGYQQILEKHLATTSLSVEQTVVSDLQSVADLQAYWKQRPTLKAESLWQQLCLATDAHLLYSWAQNDKKVISQRAAVLNEGLDTSVSPIGEAGIVVAHMHLHNLLREISNLSGSIGYKIDEAEITAALRLDNERNLVFGLDVPLTKTAQSIRACDWTAVVERVEQLIDESLHKK